MHQGQQEQQQVQPEMQQKQSNSMAKLKRPVHILLLSKRSALIFLFSIFTMYKTMHKLQSLRYSQMEMDEEKNKNNFLVYTLHPKYTLSPLKNLQARRILDLKRLGKAATTISANGVNKISVVFPVRGNIYPDGLYYVAMHFGHPPKAYYLDVDTGSDLTWLQCDAPCRNCGKGPNGLYDPKKARMVDCRHALCAHVQQGGSYLCEEINGQRWSQCDYDREYADGSSTMGILMEDTITVLLSNGSRTQTRAAIGCGYDQQGTLAKDPALTDGVMGLSNSKAALPSQLAQKGIVNNVIGHCLAGGSSNGGYLFFGDVLVPTSGMTWVQMMGGSHKEGYQARVRSIRYGADELKRVGKKVAVGGVTFDSGTSFTYFDPESYTAVLSAVQDQAESWLMRIQTDTTLPFCWGGPSPFESVADVHQYFKAISLDFGGSRILELSPEGYLIVSAQGNVCLGILDVKEASLEVTNIIGDISMRGYVVVYDNVRERIGWVRKDCQNRPTRSTP